METVNIFLYVLIMVECIPQTTASFDVGLSKGWLLLVNILPTKLLKRLLLIGIVSFKLNLKSKLDDLQKM